MMTPEGRVKKRVKEIITSLGKDAFHFFPATGGYGKSGVPDIVACVRGRFIGIECKAGDNKPTALQVKALEDIALAGGVSVVINESNIDRLRVLLQRIMGG